MAQHANKWSNVWSRRPSSVFRVALNYGLAIVATLSAFLLCSTVLKLNHPVLILFVIPILLSAFVGGLGAGLLATAISTLGISYFFLAPVHSFAIADPIQFSEWMILCVVGVLVSLLTEGMRQARRRTEETQEHLKQLLSEDRDAKEKALRESEQQLRLQVSALQSAANAIVITDRDGTIQWVNAAFTRLTGYSPKEVIGENPRVLKSGHQDAAFFRKLWEVIQGGQVWHGELVNKRKDGSVYDEEMTITPVAAAGGQITHFVAVKQDVTERKLAEEQSRLQVSALQSTANAIVITDRDGAIQWVNAAFTRLTGYSAGEAIGLNPRVLNSGRQDASFFKRLWETILSGRAWHGELVNKRKDGSLYIEEMTITPVADSAGRITHFVAVKQNVTERKEAEDALREAKEQLARVNEDLELKVLERTARLQEAVVELEHFSYTIAHDMRAPLRAMQGFGQILLEEAQMELEDVHKGYLQRIVASSERMDSLIRDVLSYSKLVHQEINLTAVDVEELLREVIESYPALQAPGVRIHVDHPLPPVLGNRAGLTQCFSNLLGNAVKFTKPGQQPEVWIWAEERDEKIRLWFEDNGIGIAPEYQEKIFGVFQKLHPQREGTGIGLALVKKAAERMGGAVGVESEAGTGSRFWLEFGKATAETPDPGALVGSSLRDRF